jgi:2-oxoisovalerate dehydrogenase E1 component beta subunit
MKFRCARPRSGTDVTVVGWGGHLRVLESACDVATKEHGISCELIDLQTIVPWDTATVISSVTKTGKLVVSHEAPLTGGFGAEVVATIQRACFWGLQAPIHMSTRLWLFHSCTKNSG